MNKAMKKDLEAVVNSIVNEDTANGTKAFHNFIRAKSQQILLGEHDEDYDDDPVDFDPSDDMNPPSVGRYHDEDDKEDDDFDEDGMEPPDVDRDEEADADFDEDDMEPPEIDDRDESGFDDDMDREGNSGSLGKRRVQPLRNRLAR